ncbi:hypothetical protein J3458_013162 [Metarhizium acridum]|uniref:uncharacterized protein n=1 Tax=Metarhizium acridum TaxID=92637 RepID=UPI001C6C825E|nr:hypothetical protein J3458_013162 [Metarhizium acridum]
MPLLNVLLAISHAVLGSLASTTPDDAHFDVLDYVDPLIGTANGGHVFPGASLPYGMAKAVADVNKELQGGFTSNDGESKESKLASVAQHRFLPY